MAVTGLKIFGTTVAILWMSQTSYSFETLFQCQKNVMPVAGMTSLVKAFTFTECALKTTAAQSSNGFAWTWEQSSCETYSSSLSGILVESERGETTFCMEIQNIGMGEQQCFTSLGTDYFNGVYSEIIRRDTNDVEETIYSKFETPSLVSSYRQDIMLLTVFAPWRASTFQFKMTCTGNCTLQLSSDTDTKGLRSIIQFSSRGNSSVYSTEMNVGKGCYYLLQAKLVFNSTGYLSVGLHSVGYDTEDPISHNLLYRNSWTKL